MHVPRDEYPVYLPTPKFSPPLAFGSVQDREASKVDMQFIHVAGPTFEEVAQRYRASFAGARLSFSPKEFKRTLAKIAFAAAVYAIGVKPFTSTPIRKIILNEDPGISKWVGSWDGEQVNPGTGLHEMQVRARGAEIHVILRLFAQFQTPEYHVVLGEADPSFVSSEAWPWT